MLMWKRELVALLGCPPGFSWRLCGFLEVPLVCLRFVSVAFSDHAHLLFLKIIEFLCYGFVWYAVICVAIILLGKREFVSILLLSS